jgi:hypothetical protein
VLVAEYCRTPTLPLARRVPLGTIRWTAGLTRHHSIGRLTAVLVRAQRGLPTDCNTQHATCNTRHTSCNLRHTTYANACAARERPPPTRSTQPIARSTKRRSAPSAPTETACAIASVSARASARPRLRPCPASGCTTCAASLQMRRRRAQAALMRGYSADNRPRALTPRRTERLWGTLATCTPAPPIGYALRRMVWTGRPLRFVAVSFVRSFVPDDRAAVDRIRIGVVEPQRQRGARAVQRDGQRWYVTVPPAATARHARAAEALAPRLSHSGSSAKALRAASVVGGVSGHAAVGWSTCG